MDIETADKKIASKKRKSQLSRANNTNHLTPNIFPGKLLIPFCNSK
jgi:hypothetical protein